MLLTPPLTAGTTRGTITTAIAAKTGTRREVFPVQPDETGQVTYEAYVRAKDSSDAEAGGYRFRPSWEQLAPEEQDAWRQAAGAP